MAKKKQEMGNKFRIRKSEESKGYSNLGTFFEMKRWSDSGWIQDEKKNGKGRIREMQQRKQKGI